MQSETEGVPTAPSLQVCLRTQSSAQSRGPEYNSVHAHSSHTFQGLLPKGERTWQWWVGVKESLGALAHQHTVPLYSAQDMALGSLSGRRWWAWGSEDPASSHMGRELAAAELLGGCVRAGGFPSQALPPPVLSGIPASSSCPPRTPPPCQEQPEAAPTPDTRAL